MSKYSQDTGKGKLHFNRKKPLRTTEYNTQHLDCCYPEMYLDNSLHSTNRASN